MYQRIEMKSSAILVRQKNYRSYAKGKNAKNPDSSTIFDSISILSHPITSADFCVFHQRSKEKTRQIRSESAEKWKIVKGIVPGSH